MDHRVTSAAPKPVYLTSQEASDLVRILIRTLEKMRVEGTGPRYMKAGGGKRSRVLYLEQDIAAWLEEHAHHSTSEY